jgi:23S rRNA (adenine2503-C2)-methyltransferase
MTEIGIQKSEKPPQFPLPLRGRVRVGGIERSSLAGLSRKELAEALRAINVEEGAIKMRVEQLWHWIYHQGVIDFAQMKNVAKDLREALAAAYSLARPEIATQQVSVDGTRKWLIALPADNLAQKSHHVECVYIPEQGRGTLCVSSQVGCTLNCTFCHTGTQRLVRNLSASEIVAQILIARDDLRDWPPERGENRAITNVVFMGMGEPLYNLDAVTKAVTIMADGEGLSISKRKITVSTAGVVPQIEKLGKGTGAMLAISLHATNDELRNQLVPLNKKYGINDLLAACRAYPGASNARRITFEYVMLKDVNDSVAEARALVKLLKNIPAKINLIPFNPWPGSNYECSDWERIERFSEVVFNAGYASPVRTPRGRDILAACGQLKSATEKLGYRARTLQAE